MAKNLYIYPREIYPKDKINGTYYFEAVDAVSGKIVESNSGLLFQEIGALIQYWNRNPHEATDLSTPGCDPILEQALQTLDMIRNQGLSEKDKIKGIEAFAIAEGKKRDKR